MESNGNGSIREIKKIPVKLIRPNPNQPRIIFNKDKISLLAETFDWHGDVDNVIMVTQRTDNEGEYYLIIDGERRWRAAKEAGLEEVSCQIWPEISDMEIYMMSVRGNLNREDFNPIEVARIIDHLTRVRLVSKVEVAKLMGKSIGYVNNALKYLELHEGIQELLLKGHISNGVALQLSLYEKDDQGVLFRKFRVLLLKNKGKPIDQNKVQLAFSKIARDNGIKPRPLSEKAVKKGQKRKSYEELVIGRLMRTTATLSEILVEFDDIEQDKLDLGSALDFEKRLEYLKLAISDALDKLKTFA